MVINGTIDDTVETQCIHCKELLHGAQCMHSREDWNDFTCWKPGYIGKHTKSELSDRLVNKEMSRVYAETFETAKQLLAEKEKKKKEDEQKRVNAIND